MKINFTYIVGSKKTLHVTTPKTQLVLIIIYLKQTRILDSKHCYKRW